MKSNILITAVLALTVIVGCTKAPPGPDYTALTRKLAEVESRMQTGIKLGDAAKMAVEVRTESTLVQFTNSNQKRFCDSAIEMLDLLADMDKARLSRVSVGLYDPLDERATRRSGSDGSEFEKDYQTTMNIIRCYCRDLRAGLSPKTEQASSGILPGK